MGLYDSADPLDRPMPSAGTISVNVDDLDAFRAWLSRELTQYLQPESRKVINEHSLGPGFGNKTISAQVLATRSRYLQALVASCNNMAMYIVIAEALIESIAETAGKYRSTEATAQALLDSLSKRMAAMVPADPWRPHGMSW